MKKNMKKALAAMLAAAMTMGMTTAAMAATIEAKSVIGGETYTAYQILNYTNSGENYSYYLTSEEYSTLGKILEDAGFDFEQSSDKTLYYVSDYESVETIAANLNEKKTELAAAVVTAKLETATATANEDNAVVLDGLGAGYYFVDSSLGSLCGLANDDSVTTIVEKNEIPTHDKKQGSEEGTYSDDVLHLNIGDTVYYQVEITDKAGTDQDIVLTDTMSDGLTLNDTISVKNGNDELTKDTDYTITTTEHGFVLTLDDEYVKTLDEDDTVVVSYSAIINANAAIRTDNTNSAELDYSDNTNVDMVKVKTYDFLLKKTDGTNALAGAEFKLYDATTGGNVINLAYDNTGYYVSATGTATIDAGDGNGINVRGLKPGTYYLEETVAPAGYNKLADRTPVTIIEDGTTVVEITVVNQAGTVLPSTGGMGTTIFYILGSIMALGAGVLLVTKKRVGEN